MHLEPAVRGALMTPRSSPPAFEARAPGTRSQSVRATTDERARVLPGDERLPEAIDVLTHGVTIRRAPRDVWPWLAQMGAGSRGGWYSYDWFDNGRQPSAARIVPELQHPAVGEIFPALPGVTDGFTLLLIEHERVLTLGWLRPDGSLDVTWTFVLDEVARGVTRLLVRVRGAPGHRFHGLPLPLTKIVIRVVHFVMQRKQLLGIKRRAESTRAATLVSTDQSLTPDKEVKVRQCVPRRTARGECSPAGKCFALLRVVSTRAPKISAMRATTVVR
jgi:hypothetical protein